MTTSPASYDWIRTIDPELKNLDAIPLTGSSPPFPWEELSQKIAKSFDRADFHIHPKDLVWRSSDNLYEGLGDSPFPLHFSIPTMQGQACWVMPEQEMVMLETWLLTKDSHPISFQDRALSESFYRFFALEVLYHINQLNFDKSIIPILTNQTTLPTQSSLCLDICLQLREQMVWGRLIISNELRRSWVEHFTSHSPSHLTTVLAQSVDIQVHLEAGKTQLFLDEWYSVNLGDFIALDSCSLDPQELTGRIMLTVNGKTAHRGKIKDGVIKILETPLVQEIEAPLQKLNSLHEEVRMAKQENDEDDLSDLNFTEEEDDEEESDFDFEDDDDAEDEFDEQDLSIDDETHTELSSTEKETTQLPNSQEEVKSGPLSPAQIPIHLTVEVGRIQMSMDHLLKLEPGNMLEMNVRPEDGVALTINGKIVGRGELLRIGEVLGVRILELGH
jgi:flagellar motor switch protein FliN/FliY